jgi:hypothetical protein
MTIVVRSVDLSTNNHAARRSSEKILGHTENACVQLIEQVRGRVSPEDHLSGEELTELAGRAFEGYAQGLLKELLTEPSLQTGSHCASTGDPLDDTWVKRQFHAGLDRAGAALREALAESRYRHTVAQGLQRKMFEAELMLRRALKARFSAGPSGSATPVPVS